MTPRATIREAPNALLVAILAIGALVALSHLLRAAEPCYVPIRVLSIHDADTLRADVLLPWGVTLRDRTLRLDYDAWEISRVRQTVEVTDEEIAKGKAAREGLAAILSTATAVYVQPTDEEYGAYNRLSASLWIKPKEGPLVSVRRWAEANGHVRK